MLIQNYSLLATSPERKIVLDIIESGLEAIQPEKVIPENIQLVGDVLTFPDGSFYALDTFDRVFLLSFGKGSAKISRLIEEILGAKLTAGWVIDLVPETFSKIKFTLGTHPLPSETNVKFTKSVLNELSNLTEKDLVLVVICGGGSALFTLPVNSINRLIELNKELLHSGANIFEMNKIRKQLDSVKSGGLAKHLFPAIVRSLIFSDVPGNDLATIASGPTVKDPAIDDKYFRAVTNELILSNLTALDAMKKKGEELGFPVKIYSDQLQGEARDVGKILIENTPLKSLLLAGGETTVTVHGSGIGGRNQELVLGAISDLNGSVIASVGSDGWDNSPSAGAIADASSLKKAQDLNLNINSFLDNNDSYNFFQKTGDFIATGKLSSNVSDLMIILKNG